MSEKSKQLPLAKLQDIARRITRKALKGYPDIEKLWPDVMLGVLFDGEQRLFELYIPGERSEDARIISRTRVSSTTGEGTVEIFPPEEETCSEKM